MSDDVTIDIREFLRITSCASAASVETYREYVDDQLKAEPSQRRRGVLLNLHGEGMNFHHSGVSSDTRGGASALPPMSIVGAARAASQRGSSAGTGAKTGASNCPPMSIAGAASQNVSSATASTAASNTDLVSKAEQNSLESSKIRVSKLPRSIREEQLASAFGTYGKIVSIVIRSLGTEGLAEIEFNSAEAGQRAANHPPIGKQCVVHCIETLYATDRTTESTVPAAAAANAPSSNEISPRSEMGSVHAQDKTAATHKVVTASVNTEGSTLINKAKNSPPAEGVSPASPPSDSSPMVVPSATRQPQHTQPSDSVPSDNSPTNMVWVSNLPPSAALEAWRQFFILHGGPIVSMKFGNQTAFVEFKDVRSAQKLIVGHNGRVVDGYTVKMESARNCSGPTPRVEQKHSSEQASIEAQAVASSLNTTGTTEKLSADQSHETDQGTTADSGPITISQSASQQATRENDAAMEDGEIASDPATAMLQTSASGPSNQESSGETNWQPVTQRESISVPQPDAKNAEPDLNLSQEVPETATNHAEQQQENDQPVSTSMNQTDDVSSWQSAPPFSDFGNTNPSGTEPQRNGDYSHFKLLKRTFQACYSSGTGPTPKQRRKYRAYHDKDRSPPEDDTDVNGTGLESSSSAGPGIMVMGDFKKGWPKIDSKKSSAGYFEQWESATTDDLGPQQERSGSPRTLFVEDGFQPPVYRSAKPLAILADGITKKRKSRRDSGSSDDADHTSKYSRSQRGVARISDSGELKWTAVVWEGELLLRDGDDTESAGDVVVVSREYTETKLMLDGSLIFSLEVELDAEYFWKVQEEMLDDSDAEVFLVVSSDENCLGQFFKDDAGILKVGIYTSPDQERRICVIPSAAFPYPPSSVAILQSKDARPNLANMLVAVFINHDESLRHKRSRTFEKWKIASPMAPIEWTTSRPPQIIKKHDTDDARQAREASRATAEGPVSDGLFPDLAKIYHMEEHLENGVTTCAFRPVAKNHISVTELLAHSSRFYVKEGSEFILLSTWLKNRFMEKEIANAPQLAEKQVASAPRQVESATQRASKTPPPSGMMARAPAAPQTEGRRLCSQSGCCVAVFSFGVGMLYLRFHAWNMPNLDLRVILSAIMLGILTVSWCIAGYARHPSKQLRVSQQVASPKAAVPAQMRRPTAVQVMQETAKQREDSINNMEKMIADWKNKANAQLLGSPASKPQHSGKKEKAGLDRLKMGSTSYQQPTAPQPQQHGTILYISEIINSNPGPIAPKSVRVLGILVAFDSTHTLALIEHAGAHLVVDAALLGPFHHRLKSLLQFIGEEAAETFVASSTLLDALVVPCCHIWLIDTTNLIPLQPPKDLPFELPPGPQVLLRARIVRNVDGLDLPLYDQALEIRRKFDRERATLGL
ncbi:hypothetical protein PhCBS80983_g03805 [Powellomyces hirtus]|uniref:RRM domain-containing protein n=1 Tax=Powellomyces hirtus TaxID=109895 RepID=A0A507E0A7_9FUNG|nr:hypothetical protein PhCBS80983_g03805 [Powellomyces hirtus]